MVLRIRDLGVTYGNGVVALESVTLEVADGEIVSVIGRSGAGKSTLLRCINGIQRPTSGSVELNGVDVGSLDRGQLRWLQQKVGFIWQEYNLVLRLSVLTNVLCGRLGYCQDLGSLLRFFSRENREIAVRSLERVNMAHRATQRGDRISGGEKQRVGIARALAQQPEIILADEPVASLDPELAWQVMSDLARVARDEGVPTIINIHSVELAKEFSDRIVGIARGKVTFDGRPPQLDQAALNAIYRTDGAPAYVPGHGVLAAVPTAAA
jgi:phosphonate transport system ATP-binding protein